MRFLPWLCFACFILASPQWCHSSPHRWLPLRLLYQKSDLVVVAKIGKTFRAGNINVNTKVVDLTIKQVLKGKAVGKKMDVYFDPSTCNVAYYPQGKLVLAFLVNRFFAGYRSLNWMIGSKVTENIHIQKYVERIRELKEILTITDAKKKRIETIEWLVRCAECEITRREGVSEFLNWYYWSHRGVELDFNFPGLWIADITEHQRKRLFKALLQTSGHYWRKRPLLSEYLNSSLCAQELSLLSLIPTQPDDRVDAFLKRMLRTLVKGKMSSDAIEATRRVLAQRSRSKQTGARSSTDSQSIESVAGLTTNKSWFGNISESTCGYRALHSYRNIADALKDVDHNEYQQRFAAIKALRQFRFTNDVEIYVRALGDVAYCVQASAAMALVEIASKKTVEKLVKALRGTTKLRLLKMKEEETNKPLVWFNREVRMQGWAAMVLGKIGDPVGRNALFAAKDDLSREVRRAAVVSLIHCGPTCRQLSEIIKDGSWDIVFFASEKLKGAKCHECIDGLISIVGNRKFYGREVAIELLGSLGNKRSVPCLLKACRDKDDGVASGAMKALFKIDWKIGLPIILERIRNKRRSYYTYRLAALIAKSRVKGSRAGILALASGNCSEAIASLVWLNGNDVTAVLMTIIEKKKGLFLPSRVIGEKKERRAVSGLVRILQDKSSDSQYAAYALGKIGSKNTVPALRKVLTCGDEKIERAAALALYRINGDTLKNENLSK